MDGSDIKDIAERHNEQADQPHIMVADAIDRRFWVKVALFIIVAGIAVYLLTRIGWAF